MKTKILLFSVVSIFCFGFANAQTVDTIPNGDFQKWVPTNNPNKEIPQGWDTLQGIAAPVTVVSYTKNHQQIDRPVYDGKYALSLSCESRNGKIYPGAISCKFPLQRLDPFINFNYALMEGTKQQSFYITVSAFRHSTHPSASDTAFTEHIRSLTLDTIEPWSTLSFPLIPTNSIVPDSGIIVIENSYYSFNPATVLYIEKMWFSNNYVSSGIQANVSHSDIKVYPNPFATVTNIQYTIKNDGYVALTVFDLEGKIVKNLVSENQSIGTYNIEFRKEELKDGLYLYKYETGTEVSVGKLLISK